MNHALNSAFPVALPVETHFIPLFFRLRFLWGDLAKQDNRKHLLEDIFSFTKIWIRHSEPERDLKTVERFSLLRCQHREDEIAEKAQDFWTLVAGLFQQYANLSNKLIAGDKSAFYRHLDLEMICDGIDNVRVIHMIRDGRDVCLSWRKIWSGPVSVASAARLWREHIFKKRAWGRKNPDRYLEVRYEDYIQTPELWLERIELFLSIPRQSIANGDELAGFTDMLSTSSTHARIGQKIDPANKDKWADQMPYADLLLFEAIAGDALQQCGYATVSRTTALKRALLLALGVIYRFCEPLVARYWKRLVKGALPFFLWLRSSLRRAFTR